MKILFLIFGCLWSVTGLHAQTFEQTVSIPALKDGDQRYSYVAFEVPAQTKSLTVSYRYDKKGGANVLDLGVFDSRFDPAEPRVRGFRGWSGGRRSTIFIGEREATHGYIAGAIPAGTWRVILGLYKVAPGGAEVSVTVKFNAIDDAAYSERAAEQAKVFAFPTGEKVAPALANGYRWVRGDLHSHTFYSDGNWTVKGLLDYAANHNLDFVAVTDHNTYAHHAELDRLAIDYQNLLVLRGEEVTTYGGHFNVWGVPRDQLIDFRVTPKDSRRLQEIIDGVRQSNRLASINHPTAVCGGCDWSYGDWTTMDAVEIWNGAWDFQDESALKTWDELLQQNRRLTAIGSSDTHAAPLSPETSNGTPVGSPTTRVGVKALTERELFDALKSGRAWISDQPKNYGLEFTARGKQPTNIGETAFVTSANGTLWLDLKTRNFPAGARISLISNGAILRGDTVTDTTHSFSSAFKIYRDTYFRVEIRDKSGAMLALTNPIYAAVKR